MATDREGGATSGRALSRLWPVVVILLAMVVVYAMGWHRYLSLDTIVKHRAALEQLITAHRVWALIGYLLIYVAAVALSVPGATFLTVAGGVLFGAWLGGSVAVVAATLGATVIFLIASTAVGEGLVKRAGPLAAKLADGFRAHAFSYLLFLRLVPVFPFWLVNLAPALVGVRLSTYILATAIGIVPGTFVYAFVGAGLDSVILAQQAAYQTCLATGRPDCRLNFDLGAAVTPQIIAALVGLGVLALVPVIVNRFGPFGRKGAA